MIVLKSLPIEGCFLIKNFFHQDIRGSFIKVFNNDDFEKNGIKPKFKEIYYSISNKDVIRGMHFQCPPFEHEKLIYVVSGKILDVVLDIRTKSKTYGKYISLELSQHSNALYIPIGCAHGFKALIDNSIVIYNQTSCYNKQSDEGILYNSFGFDWQIDNPIVSERDKSFPPFLEFTSPFVN